MKTTSHLISSLAVMCTVHSRADISLFEWRVNQDGVVSQSDQGDPLPPGSVFDEVTGLGNVQLNFSGAGLHSGLLFVDHEFSEAVNTFFNELGTAFGAPPAGLSWEIDEPGFVFGNIVDHFAANSLDNTVGTPDPDDISMALGFNFLLNPGEVGQVNFLLTQTKPSGFYLQQSDPDSVEQLFFQASLSIRPEGTSSLPEGGSTLALLMAATGVVLRMRSRLGN